MIQTDVPLGRKFNDDHQIAILLARHLGRDGAAKTCREQGWTEVLTALGEQEQIVTVPA